MISASTTDNNTNDDNDDNNNNNNNNNNDNNNNNNINNDNNNNNLKLESCPFVLLVNVPENLCFGGILTSKTYDFEASL